MTFFFYFWPKNFSKASKWPSKLVKKPFKKKKCFSILSRRNGIKEKGDDISYVRVRCIAALDRASLGAGCTRMHVARGGPTANETPDSHSARVPVAKQIIHIFNLEMNVLYDLI